MELLTRDGRVLPICRECGKLHSRRACPARKRERRRVEGEWAWAQAYQRELRRIDSGEVIPECSECGGKGNRPNFASAMASGKRYVCYGCVCGRKAAV